MEDKLCIECNETINGRADKKFCSDQCRNSFNNRRNSENNNFMRNVNATLRKNRRILADLSPNGKVSVPRQKLADKGFQFGFFTNTIVTRKGATYYFCYEFGYIPHNDWVTIVHKNAPIENEREVKMNFERLKN